MDKTSICMLQLLHVNSHCCPCLFPWIALLTDSPWAVGVHELSLMGSFGCKLPQLQSLFDLCVFYSSGHDQLHPPLWQKYYFATVRGLAKSPPTVHSNCSERMCLHARTFLVALENHLGWPGEPN